MKKTDILLIACLMIIIPMIVIGVINSGFKKNSNLNTNNATESESTIPQKTGTKITEKPKQTVSKTAKPDETNRPNNVLPEKYSFDYDYGVFLSLDNKSMNRFENYEMIIIDANYFNYEDIKTLHEKGHTVYSYLNVGSIENFRTYYKRFLSITLGEYENWDEEKWIDISNKSWRKFLVEELAKDYLIKGVDGFFIDNCDVYYVYSQEKIFDGLTDVLKKLKNLKTNIIINGGDTYVTEYLRRNLKLSAILNAVNQESVFTRINFEKNSFETAKESDKNYYLEYLNEVSKKGASIFLLEYTKNNALKKEIKEYCEDKKWNYYISSSIELD